jgi:hypothetical protein
MARCPVEADVRSGQTQGSGAAIQNG